MRRLPPYAETLGIVVEVGDDGRRLLRLDFGEHVAGRPGFLHGGAIAGLLEIAAYSALFAALGDEAGVQVKPVTITTDFMRGGRAKPTFAAAIVSRLGQRIANLESFAWQEDEAKPIASARMNFLLVRE